MSPAALRPQTQTNLQVAILAIARIHNLGEVPDSLLGHLMDQMRDALSPEQRLDPSSVYSPHVLGLVTARIEEAYGLDRPANIHAGRDPAKRDGLTDETTSFFAQDAFGLTRQQRQSGGISNEEHSLRTMLPVGAYRTSYADIDPRVWNPSSGAAGLTPLNFGTTDFARSGLDLPTTQYLFGQGFTSNQIIHAGQDASALGLNPKDKQLAYNFAVLDRFDPAGREQRQQANQAYGAWAEENRDEINRRLAAVAASEPGTAAHAAAVASYQQIMRQGDTQTGQAAVDQRLKTVPAAPGSEPGDRPAATAAQQSNKAAILKAAGVNAALLSKLGTEGELTASNETIMESLVANGLAHAGSGAVHSVLSAAATAQAPTAAADLDDFGVVAEPAGQTTAAKASDPVPTASDDMDDFGVTAQSASSDVAPAESKPAEQQTASVDPPAAEPPKPAPPAAKPQTPAGPGGIGHA